MSFVYAVGLGQMLWYAWSHVSWASSFQTVVSLAVLSLGLSPLACYWAFKIVLASYDQAFSFTGLRSRGVPGDDSPIGHTSLPQMAWLLRNPSGRLVILLGSAVSSAFPSNHGKEFKWYPVSTQTRKVASSCKTALVDLCFRGLWYSKIGKTRNQRLRGVERPSRCISKVLAAGAMKKRLLWEASRK